MINDNDILRYLEGKASELESKEVSEWVAESDSNQTHFNRIKGIWSASSSISSYKSVDIDAEWKVFSDIIASREQNELNDTNLITHTRPRRTSFIPYSIAASLAILLACYILLQDKRVTPVVNEQVESISEFALSETQETGQTLTLSDGTIIELYPYSALEYGASFETEPTREVRLVKGSALFDVKHEPTKKFMLTSNDIGIEVLGTKFLVTNKKDSVNINLESGSIKAYQISNEDNNVTMQSGDKVSFFAKKFIQKKKPIKKTIAPIIKKPVVKKTVPVKKTITKTKVVEKKIKGGVYRLEDVLEHLDKKFGKLLKIERRLKVDKNDKIRIDINQDDLKNILQDLEKTTTLSYKAGKCKNCYIITSGSKK